MMSWRMSAWNRRRDARPQHRGRSLVDRRRLGAAWALMVVLAGAPALQGKVTDEQVETAINRGVEYLLSAQDDNGQWSVWWYKDKSGKVVTPGSYMGWNYPYAGGGETCAMLSLAYASVPMSNPKMRKGFDALLEFKMTRTYNCAMRIITLSKLMPKLGREERERAWEVLKSDAAVLIKVQHKEGGWGYPHQEKEPDLPPLPITTGWWDFSNTQMAILGLGEAINAGLELAQEPLARAQDAYLKAQKPDGGWAYGPPVQNVRNNSYGSMTAAGVASLFITRDYLYRGMGCPCKGDRSGTRVPPQVDKAIDAGLEWLGKNYKGNKHPVTVPDDAQMDALTYYWLYSCERAGLASGIKYFGAHDWYAEGAEYFIKRQLPEGNWGRIPDTCFAMCFLAKGRAPILFNKLQFKGQWNLHPRDLVNLANYVGNVKEQPIRWQIINTAAPVEEWHDAPILYISAESALPFTAEEKKKLRQFTDTGGTIFFEASCGNKTAGDSWKALALEVWPEWEMKRLDKDHPLYTADMKLQAQNLPALYGMEDGMRTFALVALTDISCAWNTGAITKQGPVFQLGCNLYVYTTDHGALRARLAERKTFERDRYANAQIQAGSRTTLKVARVRHGGDWYVGKNYGAFGHLSDTLGERPGLKFEGVEAVDPSGLAAAGVQVAHLTGRQGLALGEAEASALKKYLEGGGFLLAEAAMGDARFDAEFRKLAESLGLALKACEATSPLIAGGLGSAAGYDVSTAKYRFALRAERVGKAMPELYELRLGEKVVGVYSPFDVTFSQTGAKAWGCRGYETEDALAILTNVMLLASGR